MATLKKATKKSGSEKNSLVKNINAKKKAGTSAPNSKSTVSKKVYKEMENNGTKNN